MAIIDNYWSTTLAFARSLGRNGVPLCFYGRGAGRWSRYCTQRSGCPPVENAREFLPWLRENIRAGTITRLAPTTDLIAYYASVLRSEFPPEVQRSIAPLGEIENCLVKTRFTAVCTRAGTPALTTISPSSVDDALSAAAGIGYPVIVKPASHLAVGFDDRGCVVRDEAEMRRAFRRYPVTPGQESIAAAYPEVRWPIVQRYLVSARTRVHSLTGFKDADNGIVVALASYKCEQWPPDVGTSTVQVATEDRRVVGAGLSILDAVLSRGIFEVELLEDGSDLYAIDINPRGYGFLELDLARGADVPWLWYRSTFEPQVARSISPQTAIEAHHRFRRILRAMSPRARDIGSAQDPARQGAGRRSVGMVGHWSDPVPMLLSNLHLLRHPRSLLRSQLASWSSTRQMGRV